MTTTALPDALPAPDLTRRDSMGRLVAATWHSAGASPAGTGRARWLVAVDGSACALRAAAMAARLAALAPHAEVDLVHVEPWLSLEAAETELMQRSWTAMAPARQRLEAEQAAARMLAGEAAARREAVVWLSPLAALRLEAGERVALQVIFSDLTLMERVAGKVKRMLS